jgi:hypothetical protein
MAGGVDDAARSADDAAAALVGHEVDGRIAVKAVLDGDFVGGEARGMGASGGCSRPPHHGRRRASRLDGSFAVSARPHDGMPAVMRSWGRAKLTRMGVAGCVKDHDRLCDGLVSPSFPAPDR